MAERISLCDVAKEHLLPWLAGRLDGTPEGQAFEAHIRECNACSALVTDRRQAMQALLELADETNTTAQAVAREATLAKQIQAPSWRALVQSKGTAILTVGAALLLVISYFMKPSERLLGEKALPDPPAEQTQADGKTKTEADETTHAATAVDEGAPTENSQPEETAPNEGEKPQPGEKVKAVEQERSLRPVNRKASPQRRAAPQPEAKPAPGRNSNRNIGTVVVYDQSGRLIGSATTGGQK
ncbi:MAG: hypothetical protein C4341_09565 [Armatimonadota bacterium]